MDRMYDLGINTRYFRKKRNITAKRLATLMNYSEAWLSNIENNKNKEDVPQDVIEQFSRHLGVPVHILLNEDEEFNRQIGVVEDLTRAQKYEEATEKADALIAATMPVQGARTLVHLYMKRGNIEYHQRKFEEAIMHYEKAYDIAHSVKDWYGEHLTRQNLANAYTETARYDVAEQLLSVDLSDGTHGDRNASTYLLLGRIYVHQERWEKAELTLNKALNQHPNPAHEFLINCYQILCTVFLNQRRYDEVEKSAHRVIELSKEMGYSRGEVYGLWMLGDVLISKNRKSIAKGYIVTAIELATDMPAELIQLEFLKALCMDETTASYMIIGSILSKAEQLMLHPRMLAKMYEKTSEISYKLGLIDDLNAYTKRTIQLLRSVIR